MCNELHSCTSFHYDSARVRAKAGLQMWWAVMSWGLRGTKTNCALNGCVPLWHKATQIVMSKLQGNSIVSPGEAIRHCSYPTKLTNFIAWSALIRLWYFFMLFQRVPGKHISNAFKESIEIQLHCLKVHTVITVSHRERLIVFWFGWN